MAHVVYLQPRWTQQGWMSDAACKGDTHLFFAPHGEQAEAREAREALAGAICRRCDVVLECREYARRNREQGYWGAENDEERALARHRVPHRTALVPMGRPVA